MNYAQKYDLFFPFFIKAVVNKSKAYSFLIIGIMHLQKILLSVIIHIFTSKQGTWVHKGDRGPLLGEGLPCASKFEINAKQEPRWNRTYSPVEVEKRYLDKS